jgi:hypothetical protein
MSQSAPTAVEAIVLDWLRHSVGITPHDVAPGVWRVASDAAAHLGIPARPESLGDITVVCESSELKHNVGAELITAEHPLLDHYILNFLRRDGDLRVVQAWLPPLTHGADGRISIPGVGFRIMGAKVAIATRWRPVAILTWDVTYSTDLPIHSRLRLAMDAQTGAEIPGLLGRVPLDGLRDGRPEESDISLRAALEAGERLALERVRQDLAVFGAEIEARVEADRSRIQRHLDAELARLEAGYGNDASAREQVDEWARNELDGLVSKYRCTALLSLREVMCAWFPSLGWTLRVPGRTRNLVSSEFHWSPIDGLSRPACARCGDPSVYAACIPGQHVHCVCTVARGPCTTCGEVGCEVHIGTCAIGGELLCGDHMGACAGCGASVCDDHSAPAHGRPSSRVCPRCARSCTGCPPGVSWVAADLEKCASCKEGVCSVHLETCAACRDFHCVDHLVLAADGTLLCERDRAECRHCAADANVHRRPLTRCVVCGGGTCGAHQCTCGVCGTRSYGSTHALKACRGCGRESCGQGECAADNSVCAGCHLSYCTRCGKGMSLTGAYAQDFGVPGPLCQRCVKLAPPASHADYLAWLRGVRSRLPVEHGALLEQMLEQQRHLRIYTRSEGTGRVCALRAVRPLWALLTPSLKDRVLWIRADAGTGLHSHVAPFQTR